MYGVCNQCKEQKSIGPLGICHPCRKKNLNTLINKLREERNDAVAILKDIMKNHSRGKPIFFEIAKATCLIHDINNNETYQSNKGKKIEQ